MLKVTHTEGDLVELHVDGRLVHEDYVRMLPELEEIVSRHGSLRCLIEMTGLTGITPRAAADDLRFDAKHANEIEKCAVVTDRTWHEWMVKAWGAVMPHTEVRCFKPEERDAAGLWVRA